MYLHENNLSPNVTLPVNLQEGGADALGFTAKTCRETFVSGTKQGEQLGAPGPVTTQSVLKDKERDNKHLDLLVKVGYHFLGAIITQGVMAQAILSGKPFHEFASFSDMVYALIVVENYWDTWEAMAKYAKANPDKKWLNHDCKEMEAVTYAYGSLSGPTAQARYHEIRDRVQTLMDTVEKKQQFSKKFMDYHTSNRKKASKKRSLDCAFEELSQPVYELGFLS
jgi:hypothetical protein